jgi:hypothetical protein
MSLEDLGNIGEFVAAVAVIVSLMYLAVQVRQGAASVRATMFLTSSTNQAEMASQVVRDGELARIYRVGQQDFESLTEDEQTQFVIFFATLFRTYEQVFQQDRMGLLDPEVWEGRQEAMVRFLDQPGVRTVWQRRRHAFSKSFRELVDAALAERMLDDSTQPGSPESGHQAEEST